jgi:hypothetical protein
MSAESQPSDGALAGILHPQPPVSPEDPSPAPEPPVGEPGALAPASELVPPVAELELVPACPAFPKGAPPFAVAPPALAPPLPLDAASLP